LSCADYDLLQRYWEEEPWGAYRDNIHAAIIAREIRRGTVKGAHAIKDFLLKTDERRSQEERGGFFGMFRAMVTGKRKNG
jgi:phosphoenolpyruvate synthase/pyruvate phosphate dikinase